MKPRQRAPDVAVQFERWEWNDAEIRLGLLEDASRKAIAARVPLNMSIVVPVDDSPIMPVLLPGNFGSLLYGPDGRPLENQP